MRIPTNKQEAEQMIEELRQQSEVVDLDLITIESNFQEIERIKAKWQLA